MRLVIETSFLKPFLSRNKRTICFFSVYAILIALFLGAAYTFPFAKPILRDFVIANAAYERAGPKIPFTEEVAGYTRGFKLDPDNIYAYGIESNMVWMADYIRVIVPYMAYENATPNPIHPWSAGMVPFAGETSFHVAGRMLPNDNTILLNERYVLDARWSDQRRALTTLVHELVHIQRGAYISGSSAELESATSIATVEVLAAMCNYGDELACASFWHDIESLSRASLIVQLDEYGLLPLYELYSNIFWRDNAEVDAYAKAMRYWDTVPGGLMTIRTKYQLVPWQFILEAVTKGTRLNTQHAVCNQEGRCWVNGMSFDDAWYLLQGLTWIIDE